MTVTKVFHERDLCGCTWWFCCALWSMCREAHYLERIGTGGLKDQWKWEEHLCPSKAESLVEKEKHSVDYSFKALPWKWWTAMYVISCDGGQQILPFVMYIGESTGNPLQYSCLENPWTEEPGRLQSVGSLKANLWEREWWGLMLAAVEQPPREGLYR